MSGPWESYAAAPTATADPGQDNSGPWAQYSAPAGPAAAGINAIPGMAPGSIPAPPAQQAAPAPAQPSTFTQKIVGGVEAGLNLVTQLTGGAIGMAGGAIGGLAGSLATGQFGTQAAGDQIEQAATEGAQKLTYQPRTAAGQSDVENVVAPAMEAATPLIGHGAELAQIHGAAAPVIDTTVKPAVSQAVSAVGDKAADAAAAVLPKVEPGIAQVAATGDELGIPYRPDQLVKNPFMKKLGQLSEQIPASGSQADVRADAFNGALAKMVDPDSTATRLTPDVFSAAMDKSGSTIGDIADSTPVPLDAKLTDALDSFQKDQTDVPEVQAVTDKYIDQFKAAAGDDDGVIPGDVWRKLNTKLSTQIRNTSDPALRGPLSDLQDIWMDGLQRNLSDDDTDAFQAARQQYAIGKTIEPLVAANVSNGGVIPPSSLLSVLTNTKAGKSRVAKGNAGSLGDLATFGKLLQEPGTSGTAERQLLYHLGEKAAAFGAAGAAAGPTHGASVALPFLAANIYNRAGPAVARAMVRRALRGTARAADDVEPDVTPPTASGGDSGGPSTPPPMPPPEAPAGAGPSFAAAQEILADPTQPLAVKQVVQDHVKALKVEADKQAAAAATESDAAAMETAARQTSDSALQARLLKQADKLRGTEPIPVGKAVEGQPEIKAEAPKAPLPVAEAREQFEPPAGEATEIAPEQVEPAEPPIETGEATEIEPEQVKPARAPPPPIRAGEATEIEPEHVEAAEPPVETGEATELSPEEYVKAERAWRAQFRLGDDDAGRARNVAQALRYDADATEAAVQQHERSPRAFDRAIADIIDEGKNRENETQRAASSGQSDAGASAVAGKTVSAGGADTGGDAAAPVRAERATDTQSGSTPVSGELGGDGAVSAAQRGAEANLERNPVSAVRAAEQQPGADGARSTESGSRPANAAGRQVTNDVGDQNGANPESRDQPRGVQQKVGEKSTDEAYSLEKKKAQTFYSPLSRAVENLKQGKGTPNDWGNILRGLKGVKPEEIEWSGVNDWLKAQGKQVTKQEVLNYLKEGGVPLFKQTGQTSKPVGSPAVLDNVLRDKFGDKLIQGLQDQGVLKYANSAAEGMTGRKAGVKAVMRERGRPAATLYYDRVNAAEAPAILMHELGEHFGTMRLLGPDRYYTMLKELAQQHARGDAEVKEAWNTVKASYIGKDSATGLTEGDPNFLCEVAAHLVENHPDLPFVRRLINEVRAFFYEHFGTTLGNRADADLIRTMAVSALRKASKGDLPSMNKPLQMGIPKDEHRRFMATLPPIAARAALRSRPTQ